MLPRKYEIEHLYDEDCGRLHITGTGTRPGVTTVLDKGGPEQPWLQAWKERIGEAEAERIRLDATDRGTALHALIEANLTGQPVFVDPERYAFGEPDRDRIAAMFDKVRPALEAIDTTLGVELNCEWFNYNVPGFGNGFAGSIDCVATIDVEDGRGPVPCILDWKTTNKTPKPLNRLEAYRMQVAAYRTAVQHTYPEFDQPINDAIICIVPERGSLQIIHIEAPEFRSLEMSFAARLEAYYQKLWHPAFGF